MKADLDAVSTAAGTGDVDSIKKRSAQLADSLRLFRLSLESSGPPPVQVSVQGRAIIEASRQWEESSRRLANCVVGYCLEELQEALTGSNSWAAALQELTKAVGGS